MQVEEVPVELLVYSEWNPNEMDDRTFNALCESIEEEGWLEPIQVVPEKEKYLVVGGEHRGRAAKVLGYEKVPAVLLDPDRFDEDRRKWNLVKLNILRGQLKPDKFARLYEEMAARYDKEVLQQLMGFTSEDAFRRLYKEVRENLPPELQEKLEKVADEIKTIDDLSLVLNRLFSEYGETLPSNFMVFSWGGREVLWVRCDDELWKLMSKLGVEVSERGFDMSQVLRETIEDGWLF